MLTALASHGEAHGEAHGPHFVTSFRLSLGPRARLAMQVQVKQVRQVMVAMLGLPVPLVPTSAKSQGSPCALSISS